MKKTRIFNGKRYTFHKDHGTMMDVRKDAKELKQKGYNVRVVSKGKSASGAAIYKRK